MNNQWMKIKASGMLMAFSLVATAAVSAQQWAPQPAQQYTPQQNAPQQIEEMARPQRDHTIVLNRNGSIQGRIASIDGETRSKTGLPGLSVYLVRGGKIAYQTKSNQAGEFQLERVEQGPYSFVATGEAGFAAYGVYAQPNNGQDQVNLMEASVVSPKISGIKQVLAENLPQQLTNEIMQTASLESAAPSQSGGSYRVRLVNNQLYGQITSLYGNGAQVRGTMVNLVQDGQRIADVQVDEQGNYSIPDLQPGVYDFIAVGTNGIAALRFEAVGQDSPMTRVSYGRAPKLVATTLNVTLTSKLDNVFVDQSVDYAVGEESYPIFETTQIEYASEPVGSYYNSGGTSYAGRTYYGGGTSGGGRLFGGRFGGGTGGAGRFLLLGGAAAGIVAIADDDPNDPGAQSPNN